MLYDNIMGDPNFLEDNLFIYSFECIEWSVIFIFDTPNWLYLAYEYPHNSIFFTLD
jgi:hypothetical protein